MLRFLYSLVLGSLYPVYLLLALFHKKARAFRESRQVGLNSLTTWISETAEQHQPSRLIWLHGASVGEVDQCLGQWRVLKQKWPDATFILSFFSQSMQVKEIPGIALTFHLPLDFSRNWSRLPASFRPDVFITMNWDVFPNLLTELKRRGCVLYLGSASLGADNWRLRGIWPGLWQPIYSLFDGIGCVNDANRDRLRQLVRLPERVQSTGDSRFDTVFYKIKHNKLPAKARTAFEKIKDKSQLCILASSYREGESALLPGIIKLLKKFKQVKVAIFPHHIDEEHLSFIEMLATDHGQTVRRFSQGVRKSDRLVLVDQMGLLALAYRYADFCYVGGAFHNRVHNVAEPAALAVPILSGPRIEWTGIAVELAEAGYLVRSESPETLLAQIQSWMQNPAEASKLGKAAARHLKARGGASQKFYEVFLAS